MANEKSKTYFLDVFLHLLPIPLIFFFLAFQDSFRQHAMTFLGRSILVLYILLFSYISIWLGILYCISLILYLQVIYSSSSNQTSGKKATLLQQWSEMIDSVRPNHSPYVPTTSPYVPTTSPYVPTKHTSTYRPQKPPIVGS
jgi:Ca2+/Na+ antiporter